MTKSRRIFAVHLGEILKTEVREPMAGCGKFPIPVVGLVRRAPVCSSQASSATAPQRGQGTDNICLRVSSLVFAATSCNVPQSGKCSILLIFSSLAKQQVLLGSSGGCSQL